VQLPARQFDNPHTGERITLLTTAGETGGELTQMEIRVRPGPADWVGPDHFHPIQEERFEVVSGTPIFRIAGGERTAKPGDVVTVPVGVSHIFRNGGGDELHMISEYRPGLKSVETFFATFFGLAADGKTNKRGRPPLLQAVLTLWEVRDYFVVTRPPPIVQRLLFPALAALARLRGYRASYPG
jgi:mannose-6-phosphate isomerase-like protein (cupin superfamily)